MYERTYLEDLHVYSIHLDHECNERVRYLRR